MPYVFVLISLGGVATIYIFVCVIMTHMSTIFGLAALKLISGCPIERFLERCHGNMIIDGVWPLRASCLGASHRGKKTAPSRTEESSLFSSANHQNYSPHPARHLRHTLQDQSKKILKQSSHPGHSLFSLLPSGQRYRSLMSKTEQLKSSFYSYGIPQSTKP